MSRRRLAICSQAQGKGLVRGAGLRAISTEMVFKAVGKSATRRMGVESWETLSQKYPHFPRADPSIGAAGRGAEQERELMS